MSFKKLFQLYLITIYNIITFYNFLMTLLLILFTESRSDQAIGFRPISTHLSKSKCEDEIKSFPRVI